MTARINTRRLAQRRGCHIPQHGRSHREPLGRPQGGSEQVGQGEAQRRSNRVRGTTRAAWGMGYSVIICLDFGVKACNQRSVNSRTARQLWPACDEQAVFLEVSPVFLWSWSLTWAS